MYLGIGLLAAAVCFMFLTMMLYLESREDNNKGKYAVISLFGVAFCILLSTYLIDVASENRCLEQINLLNIQIDELLSLDK